MEANINAAPISSFSFQFGFSRGKYHSAAPHMAIINVGDSALWLKITTQISQAASTGTGDFRRQACHRVPATMTTKPPSVSSVLEPLKPNHEVSQPATDMPCDTA